MKKVFATFKTDSSFGKSYEVTLRGSQFSGDDMELTVSKAGQVLRRFALPRGFDTKKLKGAIETAALQYFWEYPGKNLNSGRPDYEAFQTLTYLYNDLVDVHLEDWLKAHDYEYEMVAEVTFEGHALPAILTCTCDGAWFRVTTRIELNKGDHKRQEVLLTSDYSCAVTTTLEKCLTDTATANAALITAALNMAKPKTDSTDSIPYGGIANHAFNYRKKD